VVWHLEQSQQQGWPNGGCVTASQTACALKCARSMLTEDLMGGLALPALIREV
jgi:hypothetical protein